MSWTMLPGTWYCCIPVQVHRTALLSYDDTVIYWQLYSVGGALALPAVGILDKVFTVSARGFKGSSEASNTERSEAAERSKAN